MAWVRGDEGPDAEAAGRIVAETLLMWRAWLKSKMQSNEKDREILVG